MHGLYLTQLMITAVRSLIEQTLACCFQKQGFLRISGVPKLKVQFHELLSILIVKFKCLVAKSLPTLVVFDLSVAFKR